MDPSLIVQIIIIIILIVFSAFFSGCETAFTSANKIRLKTLADEGNKRAEKVLNMLEKYDRFISTDLIGNNLVNIMSTSIATVLFIKIALDNHWDENVGTTLSTIVMTILVLTFGEVLPKGIAKAMPEKMAMFCYPLIKFLTYVFLPISIIFEKMQKLALRLFKGKKENSFTEDELLTIIDEIEEEGKIKPYEKELISSAIKFDDIEVKEIVTPRKEIVAISDEATIEEIHDVFKESKFTRLPIYNGTIDNIIGILNEKDFYQEIMDREDNPNKEFNVKEIMQPIHFFYDEAKISIVFRQFKENKFHMAVVLDQYDGTLGLITLEDVLEELVGEIFDESDEIFEETQEVQEGQFVVAGKEMLFDAFDTMEIEISDDLENQTVNAWASQNLGHIPFSGDNFLYNDEWKITILSANKKGAISLRFEKI